MKKYIIFNSKIESNMFSFQISSDLHIEFKNNKNVNPLDFITPVSDILILAGDIGSFYKYNQLKNFLEQLCIHFQAVIYVPGNHEYYMVNSVPKLPMNKLFDQFVIKIKKSVNNLYVLNRSSVIINDVCIIGCTLWSQIDFKIPSYICRISGISTEKYNNKHQLDLKYIKQMIKYCDKNKKKLVVVTHHCPTFSVISKRKKNNDKFINLYASALDNLLNKDMVHTWVCGHIHENFDIITNGGTHLVGNQAGKPKDKITDYNKNKIIYVE